MNLATLSERNLERFGEYTSLVFKEREYTNLELHNRAITLASGLAGLGVQPGDRVGVMLPNGPDVNCSYQAILRMGAVAMPMIFLLAPPEVHYILRDSGAVAVITSPEFYPTIAQALEGLDAPPTVIVNGPGAPPEGTVRLDDLIVGAPHGLVDRDPEDLAVISYTSGTTGTPKGVMLTHANLLFNAENTADIASTKDGDVAIGCLPLAHLFGIGSGLVTGMFKMKSILLEWFTAEGFFDAVNRYQATSTALVPTMMQYMLGHPDFDSVDWSSFEWAVVAAAPVPVEMAEEFEKRTGARVLEGYGLTETSPTTSLMRLTDARHPGSCGKPVPNVEVVILDDDDKPVPAGQQGEVCIKGPNIMKGYYNKPAETAEALRGGWFHSGDIGYLDEDGYLYITDRKKDMIIRGGFNIYPSDIEEILFQHEAVMEAGVIGVPDEKMGEQVRAYVVLRPGTQASEEELLAHCRERLAKYKTPSSVVFMDTLPKNAVGKVLKKELRALAAS